MSEYYLMCRKKKSQVKQSEEEFLTFVFCNSHTHMLAQRKDEDEADGNIIIYFDREKLFINFSSSTTSKVCAHR